MLRRFMGISVALLVGLLAVPASAKRLTGNTRVTLPAETRLVMSVQAISPAETRLLVCTTADGKPSSVKVLRSSGFRELDQRLQQEVAGWRYEPLLIDGLAVPHCEKVNFKHVII